MLMIAAWLVHPAVSQTIYRTGSHVPVSTGHAAGLVLAGGGPDNDDAMRWMLRRAQGGDVVVLRASGSDGYNDYFYSDLGVKVNSVTSIVITSSAQAGSDQVLDILREAEVVFIAGGDQWNYVRHWRGTPLIGLLNELVHGKKITIGGTSAGMAVLGEVVFSAENNTIFSTEALGDPFHERMKLVRDFLSLPFMRHTVTDSHYDRRESDGRNRKGRHTSFMARMVNDWQMPARGIAANERTAIAIDENGIAKVFGDPSGQHFAFFLQAYGGEPERCEAGSALHWYRDHAAVKVYKVKGDRDGSNWFSLRDWVNGHGGEWKYWHVANGNLREEAAETSGRWLRFEVRDSVDSTLIEGAIVALSDPESPSPPNKHGNPPGTFPFNSAGPGSQNSHPASGKTAKSHSPQQTSLFGMANFENLNTALSYPYSVSKEGYFTWDGTADPGNDNLAITVFLHRDDTSVNELATLTPGRQAYLLIYPNPATDMLWIRLPEPIDGNNHASLKTGRVQFSIFAADGRLVETHWMDVSPGESMSMKVGHLPSGVYLLEAAAGMNRVVGRFFR